MIALGFWLAWMAMDLVALKFTHPDSLMRRVVLWAFVYDLAGYAMTACLILLVPGAPEVPYE